VIYIPLKAIILCAIVKDLQPAQFKSAYSFIVQWWGTDSPKEDNSHKFYEVKLRRNEHKRDEFSM